MDWLTGELYVHEEDEPPVQWADSDSELPSPDIIEAIYETTYVNQAIPYESPADEAEWLGHYVSWLCACPAGSVVSIDGYRDDTEAAIIVTSRFEGGGLAMFGECELRTQVVLIRPRYEAAYCRLELAHFHPRGSGVGIRYFGMLARRLASAGFSRITLLAAGNAESAYNGYVTWAAFGAELILTSELAQKAHEAGFQNARTTHDLFRHPEGRRWWVENGATVEGFFNLAENSRHTALLKAYMKRKGVELS